MKWGAYYRQNKKLRYVQPRRKLEGGYTQEQWEKLCSFFDGCPKCGKKDVKLTADHIIPVTLGGTNTIDNIQPLCLSCNVKKSNLYIVDYRPREIKEWAKSL